MSELTINQQLNQGNEPNLNQEMGDMPSQHFAPAENPAGEKIKQILRAETGEGSIGDYIEHPMNFNQSKSVARILRGLTGIMGNLNLAIIDVGLGVLELFKGEKKNVLGDGNSRSIT